MMRNLFVISEKSIQKTRNLFQDSKHYLFIKW